MKRFIQRIVRNIVLWAFDREDTMEYAITMQRLLNRTIAIEGQLIKEMTEILNKPTKPYSPELRESEDERNRRQIIDILLHGDTTAYDHEALAAWVEKQKEQKLAEKQDYSGLNDLERAILRGFLAAGVENVPVGIIKETASECIGFLALLDDKPAGWTGYSGIVIDKTKHPELSDAEWAIVRGFARIAGHSHFPITVIKETAQDFLAHLPAEWSDDDEKMLVSILWHVSYSVSNGKQTDCHCDLTDWLKALPERIKSLRPQPNNNLRWRRATEGSNLPESIIIPDGEEPRFGKCAIKNSYYIPVEELKNLPKDES